MTGEDLSCGAYFGCDETTIEPLNNRINSIACGGGHGCTESTIRNVDTLNLYGASSAISSTIKGTALIKGYGFGSFHRATIDSDGIPTMTIKAFGWYSGVGATVICRSGTICHLVCRNDACNTLNFQCLAGSTCNISPSGCKLDNSVANVNGIICPSVTDGTTKVETLPFDDRWENEEENEYIKEIMSKMDDNREHQIDITADDTTCQEQLSCTGQILYDDGDVECNGESSCKNARIKKGDTTGYINCNGQYSCDGATMRRPGAVSCNGVDSCTTVRYFQSPIWHGATSYGNVGCYAKGACKDLVSQDAQAAFTGATATCGADSSCRRIHMKNGQFNNCYGTRSCYAGTWSLTRSFQCYGLYM